MPELPEVESVRRALQRAMHRQRIDEVILHRPDLRIPFPEQFGARLAGQTVVALTRRAKYLLLKMSSGETLVIHLGMSGSFRIGPAAGDAHDRHDHVVFRLSSGTMVTFNDPRRFGFMDLVRPGALTGHAAIMALGPEPLSPAFNAHTLARACAGKKVSLKIALLDQRVAAGLGNIYCSEALHRAGLSPLRRASTIATPSGTPRPAAVRLSAAIKQVLAAAIDRGASAADGWSRFRVYDREGLRCRRPRCGGTIRRRTQAARSTFYCPVCQR